MHSDICQTSSTHIRMCEFREKLSEKEIERVESRGRELEIVLAFWNWCVALKYNKQVKSIRMNCTRNSLAHKNTNNGQSKCRARNAKGEMAFKFIKCNSVYPWTWTLLKSLKKGKSYQTTISIQWMEWVWMNSDIKRNNAKKKQALDCPVHK